MGLVPVVRATHLAQDLRLEKGLREGLPGMVVDKDSEERRVFEGGDDSKRARRLLIRQCKGCSCVGSSAIPSYEGQLPARDGLPCMRTGTRQSELDDPTQGFEPQIWER